MDLAQPVMSKAMENRRVIEISFNDIESLDKALNKEVGRMSIPSDVVWKLRELGIYTPIAEEQEIRARNVGASNYSRKFIQPWAIWQEYHLDPWDADIIKRVLREKDGEPREQDYKKIIHICEEKLRQIHTRK